MNKKLFFLLLIHLATLRGQAQSDSLVKAKAMLTVNGDFSNYDAVGNQRILVLDSLYKIYNVGLLKSDGVHDCCFLKIRLIENLHLRDGLSCEYYAAYNAVNKRFYKLSGFQNSEFFEFYNEVLLGGGVSFPHKMKNNRKRLKYVNENVTIEGIVLKDYYRQYYSNFRNSAFDPKSCYRRSVIKAN